ncbi:hypothetical protein [Methylobacterium soli]|uniref:Uncharacterized protein n=1 Tax=Methylobacterium soli TaxID=553447 RepID=A0A6L3SYD2_9HYPH|nr:hypothetical protein [Methylobacterium soli]KAB1077234.1 hypothetical protein F6X53_19240 [Methylobacterium soli]GJE46599.1 hypothetical protein AEGHOMDF_5805 [Methylobacterium soli]
MVASPPSILGVEPLLSDDFKGRYFEAALIVQADSWYLCYPLSYRDIEERTFCSCERQRQGLRHLCYGVLPALLCLGATSCLSLEAEHAFGINKQLICLTPPR